LVAERRRSGVFEDIGLGIDLQAGFRQAEAARQSADGDEHRGIAGVFGALDRNREDFVFLQELDRALGAARRRRHKQRRLAVVPAFAYLGHPVGDTPLQFDGRLASEVMRGQRIVGRCGDGVVVQSELGKLRRLREPRFHQVPFGEQVGGLGGALLAAERFFVTVLDVLDQLCRMRGDFVGLGHDQASVPGARQVIEDRRAAILLEDVAQRDDRHLIDRRDRPLRRRVVGAQRLDGVADELEPNRVRFAGREDVDDSSPDSELAVLVRRVFAGESRIDEQLREIGGRDVLARLQLERRAEQPIGRCDARH
jgi:hypothetical protein